MHAFPSITLPTPWRSVDKVHIFYSQFTALVSIKESLGDLTTTNSRIRYLLYIIPRALTIHIIIQQCVNDMTKHHWVRMNKL